MRREDRIEEFRRLGHNPAYLTSVHFDVNRIHFSADINKIVEEADTLIFVTPSPYLKSHLKKLKTRLRDKFIVTAIKGIVPDENLVCSEYFHQVYSVPDENLAVLGGPSHAEEVSRGIPTTNVIAARTEEIANYIQDIIMNPNFRVYTNLDMLGVELGGSLKNVIALCAGVLDGLKLGDNTKAALMTRGIVEIARLGKAMGAKAETFYGLSGIGDLIVTCTSMHSRNRRAGILIGEGKSCEEATREVNMVVEGIKTCRAAKELADKLGIEMPIVNQAYGVLFEGMPAADTIKNLMNRSKKHETEEAFLKR